MKQLKKYMIAAAFALLLAGQILPGQAFAAETAGPQESAPDFQNPDGMTLDLIYYYVDKNDSEVIAGKAERTIIPAGITTLTVKIQEEHLPEGFRLKEAKELPLTEDLEEVKIQVVPVAQEDNTPEEKPEGEGKPDTDSGNKPEQKPDTDSGNKPEQKPDTDSGNKPEQKPDTDSENKPGEKPDTDSGNKPETKPENKPDSKPENKPDNKPDNKPGNKPGNKPSGKPDPSNPKTGDPFSLSLWLTLGFGSGAALLLVKKKLS